DPGKRYSSSEELRQALASGYDRPARFDATGEAESYILSGSFVGRDRDLGALLSALGSLKEGSPSRPVAILVLGPAGIGKSRLVREFQHQVQMEEMPFFAGHCYREGSSPAGPFLEILRHLWTRAGDRGHPHRSRFGKHWQRLISILPESSKESSQGEDRVEDPSAAQGKIPESIWGFIKDEATRGPMVLHLEDLQWADELSLDVLEAILRQGTGLPPLLLTATLEMDGEFTEPLEERFERIRNHPQVLCLPLSPLKREDVNRLVSSMLGTRQDVGRLAGLLNRLTGGNPLFIEEIMKGLVEEGSLKRVGERWRFDLDRIGQGIPRSIAEMISRRLESFGAEDREILEVLSAFHRPTEPGLIHEVMKAPLLEVRQRLDGLHRKGILERLDAGGGDPLYDFRHLQFRDIVYRDFEKDAKDLHRGIGRLLEDRSGKSALDRSEELAWHFAQAGDRARGLRYSMEAARKAEALNAKQQALGHFATTLKLLGRQQKPLRAEIFFRSGEIRQRLGDHPAAIRDFRKARSLWSDLGDTASESATLERIAWSQGSTGQYDRANRHALEALAMAERIDEPIVLGRILNTLGMVFSRSGSFANALEYYQRARVLWEKEGDRKRTASTLNNMGLVCLFQGKREEGLENLMESLTIRKQLGDRGGQAQSLNNIGLCQRSMGRLEEAVRSFQECYRLAREVESTTDQATSLANQAETEIALGAYDSALETYEKAVALLEEMRNLHHLPTCLDGIGKAHFHLGDLASARSAHNRALEKARELDDRVQEGFALAALALDALHLDQAEEADELLSQARDLAEKLGNSRLRFQVLLVSRDFGRRNGDQEALASVAQQVDRVAEESGLQNDRFQALHSRALVLMAAEKWDQAEGILAEAEGIGRELGLQEEQFEILAALADCASKQGKENLAFQRYRTAAEAIGRIAERIRDKTSRERYLASPRRREAIRLAAAGEEGKLVSEKVLPGTAILGSKTLLTLHDVSRAITSILSLNELLERIMDLAIELVGAERGLLFLKEQENDEMQIRVARSPDRETLKDATNYSRHVLKETEGGRSILAIDAGSDDRFRTFQSVSLYKIRSLMCVPLKYQDRILGTVYLDTRHTRKAFSEEDLRFLEIFAGQAAVAIENARLYTQLEKENQFLKRCVEERFQYHNIIGKSPSMRVVYDLLDRVADVNLPVLIQGESGTGKELVARAIHFNSSRKDRGFVTENCAALPENLLESELFGHVRGAFTGADRDKEGLFSLADGGTMFLDEIADMSLAMQSKLLRALQEGEIRPVGSTKTRRVDVRILSATNRPPEELIREGKLRQDLYYRISVVTIPLP
ncbi:MAG: sigma 54-interacting transcriptional regulator, partial [Acidobacteriota bacterium]